ncbi:dipeptidase [Acidobacteriota bacterium]
MKRKWLYLILMFALIFAIACQNRKDAATPSEDDFLTKAKAIHDRVLTLDTHVDIEVSFITPKIYMGESNEKLVTLPKMREGGLDAVFFAIFSPQGPRTAEGFQKIYEQALEKFSDIHTAIEETHPDQIELAFLPEDVSRIQTANKKVAMIGMENGYPIGEDLVNLKKFYDLGCRYITLCHDGHNQICDSHDSRKEPESIHDGVSEFGKKVIKEMNRLGIIVDISHQSKQSMLDTVMLSKAPVIASHSACRALCDVSRNLDDEQLLALKKNGGVIHIVGISYFIKKAKSPQASVKDLVDHIDHAVNIIGVDHVGISSDFYKSQSCLDGWKDAGETFNVTLELVRRGYSEEQIAKIWSGNCLRVWEEVAEVAKRHQLKN